MRRATGKLDSNTAYRSFSKTLESGGGSTMSRLPVSCTLAAALLAMSFALGLQSLRAAPLCPFGNATLHGTYSVSGGGTVAGPGPVTSVGEVTYDGKGNSNAVYTLSLNGTIHPVSVSGTYTVNPDCTATAVE